MIVIGRRLSPDAIEVVHVSKTWPARRAAPKGLEAIEVLWRPAAECREPRPGDRLAVARFHDGLTDGVAVFSYLAIPPPP